MSSFDAEFVAAASQVLNERVPTNYDRGGAISLRAAHLSESCFEASVAGLDAVIRVRLGDVFGVSDEFVDNA